MNRTLTHILLAALACWMLAATPAANAQAAAAKQKPSRKPAAPAAPVPQPGLGDFDDFVAA